MYVCVHCLCMCLLAFGLSLTSSENCGLLRWRSGEESACQCRRRKGSGFNPLVAKIPWRRKWQPTPVFLPGKFHGQRSLVGYSSWGHKRVRHDWACTYVCIILFFSFWYHYLWPLHEWKIIDLILKRHIQERQLFLIHQVLLAQGPGHMRFWRGGWNRLGPKQETVGPIFLKESYKNEINKYLNIS